MTQVLFCEVGDDMMDCTLHANANALMMSGQASKI